MLAEVTGLFYVVVFELGSRVLAEVGELSHVAVLS